VINKSYYIVQKFAIWGMKKRFAIWGREIFNEKVQYLDTVFFKYFAIKMKIQSLFLVK
jgi:hypothetical protein